MDPTERQQINHYVVSQITTKELIAFFMTNTLKERYGDPMFKNIQLNLLNDFISDGRFPYLLKYADPAVQTVIQQQQQQQQMAAEQDFNSITNLSLSQCAMNGGHRIQHGGAWTINRYAEEANAMFDSYVKDNPSIPDINDKTILRFCWLIIFVEIVSILKLNIDESYNGRETAIIELITRCIVSNLNDKDILLAYFRSIFGGTFGEQVATAVCIGAAGYSATYLPLFINLLHSVLTNTGNMVTNAITFVSGYLPAPISDAVSDYVSSPSGLIAMGFMVYGFLKPTTIPDPATLDSMKRIVHTDTLYDSVVNFFLDMSPISIAAEIPKNVRSWFHALKERLSTGSFLGVKRVIVEKFITVNDIDSQLLIAFSGQFTTIMTCIWERIGTKEREVFFTNYYNYIYTGQFSEKYSRFGGLKEHVLSLIADEVNKQIPSFENQPQEPGMNPGGGSRATLKNKRKRRSNNKKTPLKASKKSSKKSNKNKRRSSKNRRKR